MPTTTQKLETMADDLQVMADELHRLVEELRQNQLAQAEEPDDRARPL